MEILLIEKEIEEFYNTECKLPNKEFNDLTKQEINDIIESVNFYLWLVDKKLNELINE